MKAVALMKAINWIITILPTEVSNVWKRSGCVPKLYNNFVYDIKSEYAIINLANEWHDKLNLSVHDVSDSSTNAPNEIFELPEIDHFELTSSKSVIHTEPV